MIILLFGLLGHVPTYTGCVDNCCIPPHHHTISQVIYLKGSGGLEIHIDNTNTPFDIISREIIDVDVVFKDTIDKSTFDIYIGCGGCAPNDDIYVAPTQFEYQTAELEPFTQTAYISIFPKEERKFDTHKLLGCDHFTIRLVDYNNRTDDNEIIWGPVVGLRESFTFTELLAFPIFILRNHGESWNQLGYTFWIWFAVIPISIRLFRFRKKTTIRELFYELSISGFIIASAEELTHLFYAQMGVSVDYQFWVCLLLVIFLAQGIGILFVYAMWSGMYRTTYACDKKHYFALELAMSLILLFFLGSGFFIGPIFLAFAAFSRCFVRHRENLPEITKPVREQPKTCNNYNVGFETKGNLGFINRL